MSLVKFTLPSDPRKLAHLTQQEVADRAEVTVQTVRALERGESARLGTIRQVAKVVGMRSWRYVRLMENQAFERERLARIRKAAPLIAIANDFRPHRRTK